MKKQDYIQFAHKHKIKVNQKMTIADIKTVLVVAAKRLFTVHTPLQDLQVVLSILNIQNQPNEGKTRLLQSLKQARLDEPFTNIKTSALIAPQKPGGAPVVSVRNLKVSFRNTKKRKVLVEIIRGISFDVHKGQIVGFIGESGAGKSVSARALLGMNPGTITTADQFLVGSTSMLESGLKNKVVTSNAKWRSIRAKKVSYIPQNPMVSLNPTMKIARQLIEVLDQMPEHEGKTETEKKAIITNLLERFGMTNAKDKIGLYPHEFSGGMRQRVVIAMAILSNPELIIADEPTTALDPTIQSSVLNLFKEIASEYNLAIIFVSHDISVISTLCDYVNVFYAGRIVEKAPKYELFTNAQHPYTWALLSSMPESNKGQSTLYTLDGAPPSFDALPPGDPFAMRNKYAMAIDFKAEPPLFAVSAAKNHYAATWLLHNSAPKVVKPPEVLEIARAVRKDYHNGK